MTTNNGPSRRVKTADTVFGIIEKLQELNAAKPSEIADQLDLAPSTVHDHLATLESMRYVVSDEEGYRLGLKFLDHGISAMDQYEVLEVARPFIREAAQETDETVSVYVEEHDHVVAVYRSNGKRGTHIDFRGRYIPMHCMASGKAILANYPKSRVCEIINRQGLSMITEQTITDREELLSELETVRSKGFAINDGEAIESIRSAAAPIILDDCVIGAIGIGGHRHRITKERLHETLSEMALGISNEIELLMTDHEPRDLFD